VVYAVERFENVAGILTARRRREPMSSESHAPADWLWHVHHVKGGDGTTLSTPDTPENQKVWPQPRPQKPGLGFPILRMAVGCFLAFSTSSFANASRFPIPRTATRAAS
jgi:hypothetical protein